MIRIMLIARCINKKAIRNRLIQERLFKQQVEAV